MVMLAGISLRRAAPTQMVPDPAVAALVQPEEFVAVILIVFALYVPPVAPVIVMVFVVEVPVSPAGSVHV